MRPGISFSLVVLAALVGFQSTAVAMTLLPRPTLPSASGDIFLFACASGNDCGGSSNAPSFNVPPDQTEALNVNTGFFNCAVNCASANATVQYPSPYIHAALQGTKSAQGFLSEAGAQLTYYFDVYDPHVVTLQQPQVSVTFSANGAVSLSGQGSAQAVLVVQTASQYDGGFFVPNLFSDGACTLNDGECVAPQYTFTANYDFTGAEALSVNTLYAVTLFVGLTSNDFGQASGYVDPTITIDPDQSSDFQLLFSPTTTPLPSTWIMMLSGLLGLGLFAHRRDKKRFSAVSAA